MEFQRNHGAEPKGKAVAVLSRLISQLTGRKVEIIMKEIMYPPKNNIEHNNGSTVLVKLHPLFYCIQCMLYLPVVSTVIT